MRERNYSNMTIDDRRSDLISYNGYTKWTYDKNILEVGEEELRKYCESILKKTSKVRMRSKMQTIRRFYRYCYKESIIDYEISEKFEIKGNKYRLESDIPERDEVIKLLSQLHEYDYREIRDKTMLMLIYTTGLRRSEIVKIKVSDIALKDGLMIAGKEIIQLKEEAIESIKSYLQKSRPRYEKTGEEEYLFLSRYGIQLKAEAISVIVRKYRKRLPETVNITAHSLRHAK